MILSLWKMRVKVSRDKDYWQLQRLEPCACPNCDSGKHWIVLRGTSSAFEREILMQERKENNEKLDKP